MALIHRTRDGAICDDVYAVARLSELANVVVTIVHWGPVHENDTPIDSFGEMLHELFGGIPPVLVKLPTLGGRHFPVGLSVFCVKPVSDTLPKTKRNPV